MPKPAILTWRYLYLLAICNFSEPVLWSKASLYMQWLCFFGKSWIVHLDLSSCSTEQLQPHMHKPVDQSFLFHNCNIETRLSHVTCTLMVSKWTDLSMHSSDCLTFHLGWGYVASKKKRKRNQIKHTFTSGESAECVHPTVHSAFRITQ